MNNLVGGAVGVVLISAFLLFYAIRLGSVALWIFVVGAIAMIAVDVFQSMRSRDNDT